MDAFSTPPFLEAQTLVVLDVETTGLYPAFGDRVCEIGIIKAEGDQLLTTYQTLVNPQRPISPGAALVNGLSDEQVAQAPAFGEIAPQVYSLLDGALLVCHNAPFDIGFIEAEYSRLGLSLQLAGVIDTLLLSRRFFHFQSNSLSSLARRFNIKTPDAHRALGDSLTTFYVLHALSRSLNAEGVRPDLFWVEPHQPAPVVQLDIDLPPEIQDALISKSPVEIIYIDSSGLETTRTITPRHVHAENGLVYLVAYCHLRQAERSFRLDRIAAITDCR